MNIYCVHTWEETWSGFCGNGADRKIGGTWKCIRCAANWAGYGHPPEDYLQHRVIGTTEELWAKEEDMKAEAGS